MFLMILTNNSTQLSKAGSSLLWRHAVFAVRLETNY